MLQWFQSLFKPKTPKDALGDRGENVAARHLRNKIIQQVEESSLKKDAPKFEVGDTVDVHTRIIEGDKERIQVFSGTVIMRNFRCDLGEIDIIAREGKTLVFVEVKTRAYDDPTPEEQVNADKQQQILNAAKFYLARYGMPRPPSRFDVVAIIWPTGQPPIIRHTEHAFTA